jgi:uncharacterized membrane protein YbhN (UPF0104 family)
LVLWGGVIVVAAILWRTGLLDTAWESARNARRRYLLLVLLVGMLLPIIHALRWTVALKALGDEMPPAEAADLTVSSALINYSSPGFLGASAKALLAKKSSNVSFEHSAVSITFEYGLDLILLLGASATVILVYGPRNFNGLVPFDTELPGWWVIPVGVVLLGGLGYLAYRLGVMRLINRIRYAFTRLGKTVSWPKIIALTLLYWLGQVLVIELLVQALNLDVSLFGLIALSTLPLLAGILAPVPGGIGVREATTVALAALTGAGAGALLSLAVLQRVLLVAALPLSLLVVRLSRRFISGL